MTAQQLMQWLQTAMELGVLKPESPMRIFVQTAGDDVYVPLEDMDGGTLNGTSGYRYFRTDE